MTTRLLPFDEWARLEGTEAADLWRHLDPTESMIVVVEEGGRILGCTVLMRRWCADCVWLHPDARRGGVARQLWHGVETALQSLCAPIALVPVTLEVMRRFMEKVGAVKVPGDLYAWRIQGGPRGH